MWETRFKEPTTSSRRNVTLCGQRGGQKRGKKCLRSSFRNRSARWTVRQVGGRDGALVFFAFSAAWDERDSRRLHPGVEVRRSEGETANRDAVSVGILSLIEPLGSGENQSYVC